MSQSNTAEILTGWECPPDLEVQMIVGQIESGLQELCKMLANGNPDYINEMVYAQSVHNVFGKMAKVSLHLQWEILRYSDSKFRRLYETTTANK